MLGDERREDMERHEDIATVNLDQALIIAEDAHDDEGLRVYVREEVRHDGMKRPLH